MVTRMAMSESDVNSLGSGMSYRFDILSLLKHKKVIFPKFYISYNKRMNRKYLV